LRELSVDVGVVRNDFAFLFGAGGNEGVVFKKLTFSSLDFFITFGG
jgi:hypothetical protein